ncbi:MAG TPA: HIT domain-containing protein [Blastocatellia bacterium]|nr:HIT domain-containing protein [Blastocatellia bacterium]
METLWSPWRLQYIQSNAEKTAGCVFCDLAKPSNEETDESNFLIYRGKENFVVLNIFPYTTGHLLIMPYAHFSNLYDATRETTEEMMELAKRAQKAILDVYRPQGFNMGMNLGRAAGAGIPEHFHMHLMPRWFGDVNFVTTIAETRVIPEDLPTTFRKLKPFFEDVI